MTNPKRRGLRVNCSDKCLLHYNNERYPGILENLSVSGALVRVLVPPEEMIQPGDSCGLLLCNDPSLCPWEYSGKVTRINHTGIALQFLDCSLHYPAV